MTTSSVAGSRDLQLAQASRFAPQFVDRLTSQLSQRMRKNCLIELDKGEILYHPGQADDAIHVVASGVVSLEYISASGRRSILDVLSDGDVFGEEAMVAESGVCSPIALDRSTIFRFGIHHFTDLLEATGMVEDWQAVLALKCMRRQALLLQFGTTDCECRLAMRLESLAQTLGEEAQGGIRIPLRVRHEDFAAMIGTTRSRVGFFLQKFEENGIISRPGGLIVVHPEQLGGYLAERTGVADSQPLLTRQRRSAGLSQLSGTSRSRLPRVAS